MKWILALAVAAAATPVAVAQRALDCDLLDELIAASAKGFVDHRGPEPLQGTNVFPSTLKMGLYECVIVLNPNDSAMICYSSRLPERLAKSQYQANLRRIEPCLPGWAAGPTIPVYETNIKEVEGIRFTKPLDGGEASVGVMHADEKAVDPSGHRVGFGVLWRRLPPGV